MGWGGLQCRDHAVQSDSHFGAGQKLVDSGADLVIQNTTNKAEVVMPFPECDGAPVTSLAGFVVWVGALYNAEVTLCNLTVISDHW